MEKTELSEEIHQAEQLLAENKKEDALVILDGLNYRKIHNINVLLQISELYEKAGEKEDALEILKMAHERSPIGRMIVYRLALLSLEMGDVDAAQGYYDDFVEIAPHDSLKYVIRYRIAEAQNADASKLIPILEEFMDNDFTDEWAFQLALLYRQTGQIDKCIDICDQICTWYGEGPYVEQALDLKMLYRPLDRDQEEKYRQIHSHGNTTRIHPSDSGNADMLSHTITIPKIEEPPEKFNTINLQSEIKKNIEEIMQATETGTINKNIDAIKNLVGDIPVLSTEQERTHEELKAQQEADKKQKQEIDDKLKSSYNKYLKEEYDGQIRLDIPDDSKDSDDEQIEGQLTIDDIMKDWQKTRRAARAALSDAKKEKLDQTRKNAIREATEIMDKLVAAAPQLDAGVAPSEILKEQILSGDAEESDNAEERAAADKNDNAQKKDMTTAETGNEAASDHDNNDDHTQKNSFKIPKFIRDAAEGGSSSEQARITGNVEIPVIESSENVEKEKTIKEPHVVKKEASLDDTREWNPQQLDDKLSAESAISKYSKKENKDSDTENRKSVKEDRDSDKKGNNTRTEHKTSTQDLTQAFSDVNKVLQSEIDKLSEDKEQENNTDKAADKNNAAESQDVKTLEETKESETPEETKKSETPEEKPAEVSVEKSVMPGFLKTDIHNGYTEEEKEVLTYFTGVKGMEPVVTGVLNDLRARYKTGNKTKKNLIIEGAEGSGKTTLAKDIILILQKETGALGGLSGRIDGDKLNGKNIVNLFSKVSKGSLIIEHAGRINRETAAKLSMLMENEKTGILFIVEDDRNGINNLRRTASNLMQQFTEEIIIPQMSLNELVGFAKVYASDNGYGVDDMGVLALYDRIGIMQRGDESISLIEVKNVIDRAMDRYEHRGKGIMSRFSVPLTDENGYPLLQEKDIIDRK